MPSSPANTVIRKNSKQVLKYPVQAAASCSLAFTLYDRAQIRESVAKWKAHLIGPIRKKTWSTLHGWIEKDRDLNVPTIDDIQQSHAFLRSWTLLFLPAKLWSDHLDTKAGSARVKIVAPGRKRTHSPEVGIDLQRANCFAPQKPCTKHHQHTRLHNM